MTIQEIARQAAYPTLDQWNDLPYDERRRVSLTEFQADAVMVATLREVRKLSVPAKSLTGLWADIVPCNRIDEMLAECAPAAPPDTHTRTDR